MNKYNLLIVAGPTSSGKTSFAIELSNTLNKKFHLKSEIVNADSVQIFNELKIISAHPSEEELKQAKHNLFGIFHPNDICNVSVWCKMAKQEIERLHSENKIAIICGGTGLYIRYLLTGISDIPIIPAFVRKNIAEKFEKIGRDNFFYELSQLDEFSAKKLHKNDTQRILRAYEVVFYTGKPLYKWWNEQKNYSMYNVLAFFVLMPSKAEIYERSYSRILKMMEHGAIEEVKDFNKRYPNYNGDLKKTIGYKEISKMLLCQDSSEDPYEICLNQMHINTKHYIKRQSTWLRNQFAEAKFLKGFGEDKKIIETANKYLENVI